MYLAPTVEELVASYIVSPSLPSGMIPHPIHLSVSPTFGTKRDNKDAPAPGIIMIAFVAPAEYSITGNVWADINGNGIKEGGIATIKVGWTPAAVKDASLTIF